MTREERISKIDEALSAYSRVGAVRECSPYGNGHINDTFLVVTDEKRYILQRINDGVFPRPYEIMENICAVTAHIRAKAEASGGDAARCTLTVVPTDGGDAFARDSIGSYWRLYDFVEGTVSKDMPDGAKDFGAAAKAFGEFQCALADFSADTLHEAIKDFHNTPVRFENLVKSIERDACGRAASVKPEIDFALAHEEFAKTLEAAHADGRLPLRVTHNDTKLNNILFDAGDLSPVCVIDLDTVMPGYSVNDFGDSIRFGANTAVEDERDLSLVSLDLELFEAYAKGFIEGCGGRLTKSELELLPYGAMMMTYECGIRFLADYLDGDVYFRVHREGHNLDRARNQFALVADMEKKLDDMMRIVQKYM